MNGWNNERKGSEIRCSGKSEHFLPNMWDLSHKRTGNQSYVTVGNQIL